VLILVGTSLARQLPTIRSRSQVVRFGALSASDVAAVLSERPELLGARAGEVDLGALAADAGGSVTRAAAAADDAASEARDAVLACLDRSPGDPLRLDRVLRERSDAAGKDAASRRDRLRELVGAIVAHARRAMTVAATAGADAEPALAVIEACLDAEEAIDRNANLANVTSRLAERVAEAARSAPAL